MAAPTGFPSWAYNATQNSSLIVQTLAQFNALPSPGTWTTTPFNPPTVPTDPGFLATDTRLQQMLIELRMQNLLTSVGFNSNEELTALRAEILAVDSGIAS